MARYLLILLIGLIVAGFSGKAQNIHSKDSLLKVLKLSKDDTTKVNVLLQLAEINTYVDTASAEQNFNEALKLSNKLNYTNGIWLYYAQRSGFLNVKGNRDSSILFNNKMLNWCRQINDSAKLGKAFYLAGYSHMIYHENDVAITYFEEGRIILERNFGDKKTDAFSYFYLGFITNEMHQYRRSVNYSLKAVEKFSDMNLNEMVCASFLNIGYNYISLKKYDSARHYFKMSQSLTNQTSSIDIKVLTTLNLGYIYLLQGEYDKMKPYADTGLALSKKYGLVDNEGRALWGLSVYHLSKKNYHLAKQYADSAFVIANKTSASDQKSRLLLQLSHLAFAEQNPQLGYYYSNLYESFRDSILDIDLQKIIVNNEIKFETEKKEAQIKLQQSALKQKRVLNYLLITSTVALLIIFLLTYRNYRHHQMLQQAKIDELETEKKLTATEAVLKGEEQERSRLAKDLHDGLGGMLSGIKHSLSSIKDNYITTTDNVQALDRSIDMLNSSIIEMRRVAHNMMPEILVKYGLNTALQEYCNEIDKSGVIKVNYQSLGMNDMSIEQTTAVTIYRIVQELTTNAVKHGEAKNLLVQAHLSTQEKLIALTVEDDGKGFDIASLKNASGIGWNNIQNRVDFLKGRIDINSEPGMGTSVMIEINI